METMTVGRCSALSARNMVIPPDPEGVRLSASPSISMSGVVTCSM